MITVYICGIKVGLAIIHFLLRVDILGVDILGVYILGVDILGVDILGVDILGRTHAEDLLKENAPEFMGQETNIEAWDSLVPRLRPAFRCLQSGNE